MMRSCFVRKTRSRDPEAGGALPFVLIIGTSALFVAAMSLNVGLGSRRAAVNSLHANSAFFCAETALERGRREIALQTGAARNAVLLAVFNHSATPAWYPITGACPGLPNHTYRVTFTDNNDDVNEAQDADSTLIVFADVLFAGAEVATVSGAVTMGSSAVLMDYAGQAGLGARHLGNK